MASYPRPKLTPEEARQVGRAAHKVCYTKMATREQLLMRIMAEHAMLIKEVNEHRQARGFEPLPVYDADGKLMVQETNTDDGSEA